MSLTWIISIIILSIIFINIIVISLFFTKQIDEENNSFLRTFPFEILKHSAKNGEIYKILIYIFSILCFLPLLIVTEGTGSLSNLDSMSIIICIILGFDAIVFLFINIFDVTHVKAHLILFTLFSGLTMLGGSLILARDIVAYKTFIKYGNSSILLLICGILTAIVLVFSLLISINPKLKEWARLEEVPGEKVTYKRPKRFVLAYSEWALFLSLYLFEILYFVQLLAK